MKEIYAKCEKSLVSWMTSQMVSLYNLVGLVSFFGICGVNISKVKNPGKCHDLQKKCKKKIVGQLGKLLGVLGGK